MKKLLSVILAALLVSLLVFSLTSCAVLEESTVKDAVWAANEKIMAEKKYAFVTEEVVNFTENGSLISIKTSNSYTKSQGALFEGGDEVTRVNFEQTISIKEKEAAYRVGSTLKQFLNGEGTIYNFAEQHADGNIKRSKTYQAMTFEQIKPYYDAIIAHSLLENSFEDISKSVVSNEVTYIAKINGEVLSSGYLTEICGSILGESVENVSFEQKNARIIYVINAEGYLTYSFVSVSGDITATVNGEAYSISFSWQKGVKAEKWGNVTITALTDGEIAEYSPVTD